MSLLTDKALATIILIYQVGQGAPAFLFEEIDTIDAIVGGFVKNKYNDLYLTEKGQQVIKEIYQYGEVKSFNTALTKNIKKGVTH